MIYHQIVFKPIRNSFAHPIQPIKSTISRRMRTVMVKRIEQKNQKPMDNRMHKRQCKRSPSIQPPTNQGKNRIHRSMFSQFSNHCILLINLCLCWSLTCSSAPTSSSTVSTAKGVSSTSVDTSAVAGASGTVTKKLCFSLTVTSSTSSPATPSLKLVSGSLINGSTSQKKDSSEKVVKESSSSSPTTSGRLASSSSSPKVDRLSSSPEKQPQPDRRSNGASPKPNTSKSKCATGMSK